MDLLEGHESGKVFDENNCVEAALTTYDLPDPGEGGTDHSSRR
jgi:hypothetical protein